jgi:hypothetical protein
MCELKIRRYRPGCRIICITQSEEGLVILEQRNRGRLKKRRRGRHFSGVGEIAAGRENQAIGRVERIGRRPGQPSVAVRVKAVVPRQSERQRPLGVAALAATTDGRFLRKQQPALDVHVFESKGVSAPINVGNLPP